MSRALGLSPFQRSLRRRDAVVYLACRMGFSRRHVADALGLSKSAVDLAYARAEARVKCGRAEDSQLSEARELWDATPAGDGPLSRPKL